MVGDPSVPAPGFAWSIPGARRAVDRNRLRRQLRAVVATLLRSGQLRFVPGDYLVVVRVPSATTPELATWVSEALRCLLEPADGIP